MTKGNRINAPSVGVLIRFFFVAMVLQQHFCSEVADLDYVQSRCKPGYYRFAATVYVYSGSCEYANQAAAFGPVDNDDIAFGGYSYAIVMLNIPYSREIHFFDIEEIAPDKGISISIFTPDGNIQCGICVYVIAVEYPPVDLWRSSRATIYGS